MSELSKPAQFQLRRGEALLRQREEHRSALRASALRIAAMLKADFGATRIWLFGSLNRPWFHEGSDIDLAAEGIPEERRADAWDRALELAGCSVDLVCLEDAPWALRQRISSDGELLE